MGFSHNINDVVQATEAVGVGILTVGGLIVLIHSIVLYVLPSRRPSAYQYFRRHLGRTIILGLEVLIAADIIRTVVIEPDARSVEVLTTIVLIRILLSWSLSVEIDGVWPWKKAGAARGSDGALGL